MFQVQQKDPQLASRVVQLIESGLDPQMIAETLLEESKPIDPHVSHREEFSDKIMIASQALAFRKAVQSDIKQILIILKLAYDSEVYGPESFRSPPAMTLDTINLDDDSYKWIVVEVPCGRGIENDGAIIGVCCYSTDGISRKNGVAEGHLGSIRYMGILPQYQHVLIGQRLLSKIETLMKKADCCRSMVCIPDIRRSMSSWIERRGYYNVKTCPYPANAVGHVLVKPTQLIMYVKSLVAEELEEEEDNNTFSSKTNQPSSENKHLPPIWRNHINTNSASQITTSSNTSEHVTLTGDSIDSSTAFNAPDPESEKLAS